MDPNKMDTTPLKEKAHKTLLRVRLPSISLIYSCGPMRMGLGMVARAQLPRMHGLKQKALANAGHVKCPPILGTHAISYQINR